MNIDRILGMPVSIKQIEGGTCVLPEPLTLLLRGLENEGVSATVIEQYVERLRSKLQAYAVLEASAHSQIIRMVQAAMDSANVPHEHRPNIIGYFCNEWNNAIKAQEPPAEVVQVKVDDFQDVWIIIAEDGDQVMMCPKEPDGELLANLAKRVGKAVTVQAFKLVDANRCTKPIAGPRDAQTLRATGDWAMQKGSQCIANELYDIANKISTNEPAASENFDGASTQHPDLYVGNRLASKDRGYVLTSKTTGEGTNE